MNKEETKRLIVVGGGAAGFFTAINFAESHPDYSILILEKTTKLLSKVKVSGGGRCNVTHACFDNSMLVKKYPRGEKELRNLFSRFNPSDTIEWFKKRGVELKTEPDGRIFPTTDNSETIINCFLSQAERLGIKIKTEVDIKQIRIDDKKQFALQANGGGVFICDKLVVATGGQAKEESYVWLKDLGHTIIKPVPSLFTFNMPGNPITKLMGVSVPQVRVRIADTKLETQGPLLITHWGMSGPAILTASAWGARILHDMNYNFTAIICWLPDYSEESLNQLISLHKKNNAAKIIYHDYLFSLPKRLWEYFIHKADIKSNQRWGDLNKKQNNTLVKTLLSDEYGVSGKTTFKEEFVSSGGIHLKEIDFSTMQSKIVPNLYFAGEVTDVDGVTGGFNFQNAWSSAWVAATNIQ